MKLTIEEANKYKCPSPVQCCASHGFIEGWNQAIETILSEFENDPIKYSPTPNQYLKINELKVKGEK